MYRKDDQQMQGLAETMAAKKFKSQPLARFLAVLKTFLVHPFVCKVLVLKTIDPTTNKNR